MADPLLGAVVGERYRLTHELGAGGMATVYRGEHLLLHKAVAVKVLRPELAIDETMAARFEHEAIAAARLEHPNIVSITDFGRTPDGRMFLVMEHLDGTPLAELIADELRLGWERAVELTRQLLRGLAHAHDMGVVHRDLKPSNVMVTRPAGGQRSKEVAKIIDFGIAKIIAEGAAGPRIETQAGIVFGTADFLAPERLLGKGDSDPRSDLYAAGVLLYEALTGVRPFHDPDPYVVVERALKETARPPSQLVPGLPPELDDVVAHALAKEPGDRYPSARAMLAALDPVARRPAAAPVAAPVPADESSAFMSSSLVPADDLSAVPLELYRPPRARRPILWAAPLAVAAVVVVAAITSRGAGGLDAVIPRAMAPPATVPADPEAQLAATVEQAASGATVADRQRAFDRLVALGYGDRVPWLAMLGRDLEQLETCEERREVAEKLRKLSDPQALVLIQQAAARPDNGCLAAAAAQEEPKRPARKKRARGGGHF
jgi:tRNA A-37 threonylcarbamoyl transferase component Bud32